MLNYIRYVPRLNLTKIARTNFCPPPMDWKSLGSVCIGTKSRNLGDALVHTTLPRVLKQAYPQLNVYSYVGGFNPVVFYNNPHVNDIDWLPRCIYGDDCMMGSGQLIQLKEQFFSLKPSTDPRPEIFLTETEKKYSASLKEKSDKPICIIHTTGKTYGQAVGPDFYNDVVAKHRGQVSFWQFGMAGQTKVLGCDQHFLGPPNPWHLRNDFATMAAGDFFIGVDSGPMYMARAFDLPSLIFCTHRGVQDLFERRKKYPYFLHGNHKNVFLYEKNTHVEVPNSSREEIFRQVDEFIEQKVSQFQ